VLRGRARKKGERRGATAVYVDDCMLADVEVRSGELRVAGWE